MDDTSPTRVYFRVNLKELFGVDINYPGLIGCLKRAFAISKKYVPYKTGLMLSSYTMEEITPSIYEIYFDRNKIVGKKRLGQIVKDYYPQYLVEYSSRMNWLDILSYQFYKVLITEAAKLEPDKEYTPEEFEKIQRQDKDYSSQKKEYIENTSKILNTSLPGDISESKEQSVLDITSAYVFFNTVRKIYLEKLKEEQDAREQEREKKKKLKEYVQKKKEALVSTNVD